MENRKPMEFIALEKQTEEERKEWIRQQGVTLYETFSTGETAWVGPLLGGHRTKSPEFTLGSVDEVAYLAVRQLSRTDEEIREDHVLIGFNPEDIAEMNPREDIITLLNGMSDAAREYGDANTIRVVEKITKWSEDPESEIPTGITPNGPSEITAHRLPNGGTVFVLNEAGGQLPHPLLFSRTKPVA